MTSNTQYNVQVTRNEVEVQVDIRVSFTENCSLGELLDAVQGACARAEQNAIDRWAEVAL